MFANIKNGQIAKKGVIVQVRKKICEPFLKIFWDEGFISGYRISPDNSNQLEIFLKYKKTGQPVIQSLKSISTPGKRLYYSSKQIWKIDSSKNFIIFSTTKGIKSITECKKLRLGGEPFVVIT